MDTHVVNSGGVNSYRPPRGALEDLVGELLTFHPAQGDSRFGCYCIAGTNRYSDVARSLECSVFEEFFGNDPAIMTAAYADYEAHSMFMLVVDREQRRAAGTLRFIKYSERGLKTLNDIAQPPLKISAQEVADYHGISDLTNCWDAGTLAVTKSYRGRANAHLISTMLYGMFHGASRKLGVDHAVTVLDEHAYRQITQMLGVPFVPILGSQPFNYLGSESSRAAYLRFPELVPSVEAHLNSMPPEQRAAHEAPLTRVMYARDVPPLVHVR